jgi:hypothetical protein
MTVLSLRSIWNVVLGCRWVSRLRLAAWVAGLAILSAGFASCSQDPTQGYSTRSTFRSGIKTVAVPIFQSDSYTRDVEFELTDALVKEIEARTPYKVTDDGRADTILTGRIRSIKLDQLSKSRLTGLSEEVIVSVTIDFQWKDLRNGRTLVDRQEFAGHGLFVPSRPSGEPIELGQFAAVQQLARDVVAEMRANW